MTGRSHSAKGQRPKAGQLHWQHSENHAPAPPLDWVLKATVNGPKSVSQVIATNGQVSAQNKQVIKQSSGQRGGPSICLHQFKVSSAMAIPTELAFCRRLQERPVDRRPPDCQLGVDQAKVPLLSAWSEPSHFQRPTEREAPRTSAATAPSSGSRGRRQEVVLSE